MALGCYKVTLSSGLKRSGAHAFYESMGFRCHGFSYLLSLDSKTTTEALQN